jgi:hypothetical protein
VIGILGGLLFDLMLEGQAWWWAELTRQLNALVG